MKMNTKKILVILPVIAIFSTLGLFGALNFEVQAQTTTQQQIQAESNPNWGTYDQSTGLYYHPLTKLYYNPTTGLYHDRTWNRYFTSSGEIVGNNVGGTMTPRVPDTGMGGTATATYALLVSSGLIAAAGAAYVISRRASAV